MINQSFNSSVLKSSIPNLFAAAMSDLIQEQQHLDPAVDSRFSMLCLTPSATNSPPCSSCGSRRRRRPPRSSTTPLKRRSPTPSQSPSTSKKLLLDHQQQEQEEENRNSFSKIDLPIPFPPIRRTVSDPTGASHDSALPPLPLRRTASDPNFSPETNSESAITATVKEDSPDSKRLRRMKDRLKEMNQLWKEVMIDDEEENDTKKNGECCKEGDEEEEEKEETVGVERVGEDSLKLQLKCPCGNGFEILLSGNNCFYKLL